MVRLVVTVPAYNETKNIRKVIENIPRDCCDDVKILVLDDGSKDNTAEVAYEAGADLVVSHIYNLGLAITYRDSLEIATEKMGADIIVNIDADGQYDPKEIPKLIKPILNNEADIVLGSRFEGYIEYMPPAKRWGNRLATRVINRVTGQKFTDCQTGFRAITRDVAFRINVTSNFTYTQESLINALHHNYKIVEVPVAFYKREGENRLFGSVWDYAKRGGATLIRTYLYHRPLRFFFYLGSLIFAIGFIIGIRVFIHYLTTGMVTPYLPSAVLTAVLLIVGVQVIALGFLSDMVRTNQNLHEEILYKIKKSDSDKKQITTNKLDENYVEIIDEYKKV